MLLMAVCQRASTEMIRLMSLVSVSLLLYPSGPFLAISELLPESV